MGYLWTCAASAPAIDSCRGSSWRPAWKGGGSVIFRDFVAPVNYPVVMQFAEQWQVRAGDAEFERVRRAAQREIDALVGWVRLEQRPHLQSR
jgi:hypothetical protein